MVHPCNEAINSWSTSRTAALREWFCNLGTPDKEPFSTELCLSLAVPTVTHPYALECLSQSSLNSCGFPRSLHCVQIQICKWDYGQRMINYAKEILGCWFFKLLIYFSQQTKPHYLVEKGKYLHSTTSWFCICTHTIYTYNISVFGGSIRERNMKIATLWKGTIRRWLE